jgi:NADPH-dependent 2,4-dienoyl-CoA reductase/sulfur reductase-like enzyme/rhodanese-related sulfurtransferase
MNKTTRRILIVGGVAGGASCAARARRLCEKCEIVIFDRGPHVSFANCGLPYFVGEVIQQEEKLLVASPALFSDRFNIGVHTETEVLSIDRDNKSILVRDLNSGEERTEHYDALVLSPGARAIRPPLPGIDLPGIHVLRNIPDSQRIRAALKHAKRAVIVGGGFIGLEMAENLSGLGLNLTLIEKTAQVMPPLDPEMTVPIADRLIAEGVDLRLGVGVTAFAEMPQGGLTVTLDNGDSVETDIVILAIGVQPETSLAVAAGIELGERGGIKVDASMRTNDRAIWAVGDAVEVNDLITGVSQPIPLAGPANRQGRIAATSIIGGHPELQFRGVQATAICGVFGLTVASTGASEKSLIRCGNLAYEKVYLHPGSHVSYFPGATPIHIKLLFSSDDGRILGAQALGENGVARRIDVLSMAIQMGATVYDLEESELCYAPQFGAAKDPVNFAGMIAANHLRGDLPLAHWEDIADTQAKIIDVRSPAEYERRHLPGALNIPLESIRQRLSDIPSDQEVWLICEVGQRAYYATRLLMQNGYKVRVLSGGMKSWDFISRSAL